MKILIGCEFSGIVRDAFTAHGHDAISCDIIDTEKPGKHYKGNVLDILNSGYDGAIFHPPCTFLTNSGVRWLYEKPGRWEEMKKAAEFFKTLLNADIPKICVENPIPHKYAMDIIGKKYTQIIQPWQFGHGETKSTCLWLKGFPELKPTKIVSGRLHKVHHEPPSEERQKNRSRTYVGIAQAMAEQWS